MAELSQDGEKYTEDANVLERPSIGVISCDDEGYETAGKKTLTIRQKSSTKEGRKVRIFNIPSCVLHIVFVIHKLILLN